MHTEAGNRLGRARAHHVLGSVALEQDDPARATEHLTEAARLHEALRTGEADEIRVLVDALG